LKLTVGSVRENARFDKFVWRKYCARRPPHEPRPHTLGDAQSTSAAQLVLHVVAVSHVYPPQVETVGIWQWLFPSHVAADRNMAEEQVTAAHTVPATWNRHAPAPSQVPSVPQLVASVVAHAAAGVGGVPAGTNVHAPSLPLRVHE